MESEELEQAFKYWRKRVFFCLWITYGSFYLCRVNLSIALPGIMQEFGYSRTEVGLIGTALFVAYALGQFVNGQLGDKLGARKLITLGIFVSAMLNIAFGFATALTIMAIIWGANGYFQSMGWPPSVKTLANWFPPRQRGKVSGLYGSSFQIGNAISWLFAGYLCLHYGWRYVFWVPPFLFLLSGIQFYLRCRNSPEDIGLPPIEQYERMRRKWASQDQAKEAADEKTDERPNRDEHLGFGFTLRQTVGNSRMWCVALAFLSLGLVSFGFLYWLPTYMSEVQKITISTVSSRAIVFPLAGSLGALVAGWTSDRFFKSRRTPIIVLMSMLAGVFVLLYSKIPVGSSLLSLCCLGIVGFMVFGAHATMVTTVPMDYGTRKAAASTAGFIDSFGYIGASIAGVGTGWLVDNYGWNSAFYLWAGGAFIASILMLLLWAYIPPEREYM